jgi:hypothetical protein
MKHSTKNKVIVVFASLILSSGLGVIEHGLEKPLTIITNALRNTAVVTKLLDSQKEDENSKKS